MNQKLILSEIWSNKNWCIHLFQLANNVVDSRVGVNFKSIFRKNHQDPPPIGSMYGIFTYIGLIFMVNVGKYAIHGWYGPRKLMEKTRHNEVDALKMDSFPGLFFFGHPENQIQYKLESQSL